MKSNKFLLTHIWRYNVRVPSKEIEVVIADKLEKIIFPSFPTILSSFSLLFMYTIWDDSDKRTECVMDLEKLNLVKLGYGGLGLGSSQFLLLPQMPQKMMLASNLL